MNHNIVAILSLLVVISATASVLVASDDSSAATETYTFEGYVGTIGDNAVIAHEGATVKISTGVDKSGEGLTNANGFFSIEIALEETDLDDKLKFECVSATEGYTMFNTPSCISMENDGNYYLSPSKLQPIDNKYVICEKLDNSIIMANTLVDVSYIVTGADNDLLKDAEITLSMDGHKRYTAETSSNGSCIITDVVVGEYEVEIHCNGYKTYKTMIVISKENKSFSAEMTEKSVETYYGLTTYQILTLAGVAIGLIFVVVSMALYSRSGSKVDSDDIRSS